MNAPASTRPVEKVHRLPNHLLQGAVRIHVIGCGGTGSQLLPGLARLHRTMNALGHSAGLDVTVWDDDTVAPHNCVRQNFFETDVGLNKADIMVYRINVAHAGADLRWKAEARRFGAGMLPHNTDFVIGCVDSKAARQQIAAAVEKQSQCYWIDIGNRALDGQVIVGLAGNRLDVDQPRLPLVSELLPEILSGADDNEPSCSAIQSIMRQGVITNQMGAAWALAWLSEALQKGEVGWSGVFFNLAAGRVTSIPVDPAAWERMGHKVRTKGGRRRKNAA